MDRFFLGIAALAFLLSQSGCGTNGSSSAPAGPLVPFYRWAGFPVPIHTEETLLDGGPRNEDLLAAVSFWEAHAGKRLFQLSGPWRGPGLPFTGNPSQPDSILANAMMFEGPWTFEPNMAGTTIVRFEGNTIQGAVILLDPATPLCTHLCEGLDEQTSLRRLIAHELGHFLGLGHVTDRLNIMYPAILPGGSLDDRTVDEAALKRATD